MCQFILTFLCYVLLLAATFFFEPSQSLQENSTVEDEQISGSTVQYEFHRSYFIDSIKNNGKNDSNRHEIHVHSIKHSKEDKLMELHLDPTKDDERNNSVSREFRKNITVTEVKNVTNSAKNNYERNNSMLRTIHRQSMNYSEDDKPIEFYQNFFYLNFTKVNEKNNSMSYEIHANSSKNDDKINFVPYDETCDDDDTCISLCCPFGYLLIGVKCVIGEGNYPLPDVYDAYLAYTHGTSNLTNNKNKTIDQAFKLVVHDPCPGIPRFRLDPEQYPDDKYRFLFNGSLYQPNLDKFVEAYCVALLPDRNQYDVTVCFPNNTEPVSQSYLYPVGLIISLPFLLTTFVVYSIIPELRNMHGYTLRGYVGSLFVAYTVLSLLQLIPPIDMEDFICITLAFVIHFSFLASFFWLNVMCFDIWWTFGGFRSLQGSVKQREKKKFIMYSIYAWGSASIFTLVCAIMDFVPSMPKKFIRPEFGAERCWFSTDSAKALYFYGPMSLTVLCNICLFISTALKIVRHKKDTAHHLRSSESRRHDDNKQWFNLYLKLFIVMGINWSMEIVSWLFKSAPAYVWYLTDLTNTLQGLIIFIIFVWKEKIKRLLLKRFDCQDRSIFSRNSIRSGLHSSASRTCTTTSGVMPMQEKVSPYAQVNYRAKSLSDEADT
ncbi:G-protein coupled receptor Mth2-like isoform X2 [Pseudomyrmex gracilis]|nr:G-protein coupled receptor Mth2-like isoform X2 [Pseudomyrmex gracilis]